MVETVQKTPRIPVDCGVVAHAQSDEVEGNRQIDLRLID